MARQRESFLDALILLPWWVGVLVGIFGFAATTLVGPLVFGGLSGPASHLPRLIGYFFLVACLVGAGGSALRAFLIRRKYDAQKSIEDLRKLSWQQFESIIGEAFRRCGYFVVENGGGGADGGVDVVLHRDGKKFYVQCKQWKQRTVGVKPVRELFGVISARGVEGGFFVISGTYTKDAREFADECGIELIDGPVLEQMVLETRNAEPFMDPTASRRDVTSRPAVSDAPTCPKCGEQMVMRTAKRGASAGKDFWGCLEYPRCRGTRAA